MMATPVDLSQPFYAPILFSYVRLIYMIGLELGSWELDSEECVFGSVPQDGSRSGLFI